MKRFAVWLLAACVTGGVAPTARAQSRPLTPRTPLADFPLTSTSDAAKAEFRAAVWEFENAFIAKAAAHLDKAIALDPRFGLAHILHGWLAANLSASERKAEQDAGLGDLGTASANEILLGLGWREWAQGRIPESRDVFAALNARLPADPDVGWWHANRQAAGKSRTEAIVVYQAAMKRNPDHPLYYRSLGYAMWLSGDTAGSIAMMREHVAKEPEHANSHESLAEILGQAGRVQEAIAEDRRALALDSTFGGGWVHLADLAFMTGDVAQARSHWASAGRFAIDANTRINLRQSAAVSRVYDGDARGALAALGPLAAEAEAAKVPQAPLIHERMAVIEAFYGNRQAVAGHLARAAQLGDSNSANQYSHAAVAYAAAGQLDQARAAAARYAQVASNNNLRHTLAGFVAFQAGDLAGASAELVQADPPDLLAKELLAELQEKQGNAKAAQDLRARVGSGSALNYGAETIDVFAVVAKTKAKRTKVS